MTDEQQAEQTQQPDETPETLDVPVAELRPALEAVLMLADPPRDHVTLAIADGYPPEEVRTSLAVLSAV